MGNSVAQIKQTVAAVKAILDQHKVVENHTVYLMETGKDAHIISIEYFTGMEQSMAEFVALREQINFSIIAFIAANNIEIAGASQDITIKNK